MGNPANRLLTIIEAGTHHQKTRNCRDVWKALLNANDDALLLSRIGKSMALIRASEEAIKAINGIEPTRYLGWIPQVNTAFSQQNLNATWSTFIDHINAHTINYLSNTADILEIKSNEPDITNSNLEEITSLIEKTRQEILDSETQENLKIYILQKLREIQVAIDEYGITGKTPIVESVEAAFGKLVTNKDFREDSTNNPATENFWKLMGRILIITSITLNVAQLPAAITHYFPSCSANSHQIKK